MKVLVIIPAYNEQDNILRTVKDLEEYFPEADKIIVNDASIDNTKDILINNNIDYLDLPINLGIGGGVQTGYIYAKKHDFDIAIQMDGDGQHCASEIKKIIFPIVHNEADIVIGSRFLNREGFQSSIMRRFGINLLSFLIFLCTKQRVKDVTSGFRAINRKYIDIFSKEYAQDYPEPEAIIVASNYGAKIVEVPVVMKNRQGGLSSISPIKSIYYMIKVSLAIIIQKMGGK